MARGARDPARTGTTRNTRVGRSARRRLGEAHPSTEGRLMLLLDSEAISAMSSGPAQRRDRVRALIAEMRRRDLPIGTVAAVLAEVIRGRAADAAVFSGLRRERVQVHPVDT